MCPVSELVLRSELILEIFSVIFASYCAPAAPLVEEHAVDLRALHREACILRLYLEERVHARTRGISKITSERKAYGMQI